MGRNPSYVSRLIKEYTGKNFTQLLTDKRIHEAKHLLKDTSLKVGEIAERVGYVNVRYFNRVFKATMNMSANDYRKKGRLLNENHHYENRQSKDREEQNPLIFSSQYYGGIDFER